VERGSNYERLFSRIMSKEELIRGGTESRLQSEQSGDGRRISLIMDHSANNYEPKEHLLSRKGARRALKAGGSRSQLLSLWSRVGVPIDGKKQLEEKRGSEKANMAFGGQKNKYHTRHGADTRTMDLILVRENAGFQGGAPHKELLLRELGSSPTYAAPRRT